MKRFALLALLAVPLFFYFALLQVQSVRQREARSFSIDLGSLKQNEAEKIALRALSIQLRKRPRAQEIRVLWQDLPRHVKGMMSFNRQQFLLISTQMVIRKSRGRSCSIDERTVHQWAQTGKMGAFCASTS